MKKIKEIVKKIKSIDKTLIEKTQNRLDNLTKPLGSLGVLEELAKQIVAITGKENPKLNKKVIFLMAADHGIAEEKVSAYPKEVTGEMVYNFISSGACINVLAKHVGAKVIIVDMGVAKELQITNYKLQITKIKNFIDKKIGYGTKNFLKEPAMTRNDAIKSIEAGIDVVYEEYEKNGIDIIGTGDMGIGNTTSSSAIVSAFTKEDVRKVTGRGTGIDDATLEKKIKIIENALKLHKPNAKDPIDVLSKVGGFEIGGLVGVILAGASLKIPVVIDGFISGAAALIAVSIEPKVKEYMIASHCSAEIGHKVILEYIGLNPILDLNMRLGEGTGAALAMNIIEAAIKILTRMATFDTAKVSKKL
jgi:nicotinate-nucleotide--dimethylbenzimidazole phosphoribosyltransferase